MGTKTKSKYKYIYDMVNAYGFECTYVKEIVHHKEPKYSIKVTGLNTAKTFYSKDPFELGIEVKNHISSIVFGGANQNSVEEIV